MRTCAQCQVHSEQFHAQSRKTEDVAEECSRLVSPRLALSVHGRGCAQDWQLSQFWYTKATQTALLNEVMASMLPHELVVFVSTPSIAKVMKARNTSLQVLSELSNVHRTRKDTVATTS